MTEMDEDFFHMMDMLWLAVDESGQLAACWTSGFGDLPASVKTSIERWTLLTDFTDTLPVISEAIPDEAIQERNTPHMKRMTELRRPPDFIDPNLIYSQQGFFVYDASTNYSIPRRLYHRACWPTRPLTIQELPPDIQKALAFTCLKDQRFDSTSVLDVSQIA